MAASNANPIDLSKARIADLQDAITTRLDDLKREATRRTDIAVGTARDAGLGLRYTTTEAAVRAAAQVAAAIPFGKPWSKELGRRADALESKLTDLSAPSIAGYDELNVKQVTDALEGLGAFELGKIHAYEVAHKNRKTVLGAVERLQR